MKKNYKEIVPQTMMFVAVSCWVKKEKQDLERTTKRCPAKSQELETKREGCPKSQEFKRKQVGFEAT